MNHGIGRIDEASVRNEHHVEGARVNPDWHPINTCRDPLSMALCQSPSWHPRCIHSMTLQ